MNYKFFFLKLGVTILVGCWLTVPALASTANTIVNLTVNSVETVPTSTPPNPGGGGPPVCGNPLASNYVPGYLIVDNSLCVFPETVPNALTFTATYIPVNKNVLLEWRLTNFINFEAVRIVKAVGRIPTDPNDGTLVYDGTALSTVDNNVSPGQTIYYVLFVRSITGQYSSGVLAYVTIPVNPDTPPNPPPEEPPTWPPAPPSGGNNPSPSFYISQPTIFTDPLFPGSVSDKGQTDHLLFVYVDYKLLPRALKTVVVTLVSTTNPRFKVSALLRINDAKTLYSATFAPLPADKYRVYVDVLNYDDQSLNRFASTLIVSGPPPSIANLVKEAPKYAPWLLATGAVAGALNLLLLGFRFNSLFDLYLLISRALGTLFGFLGWRKKRTPWGTVFDTVTKQPIDPAYVVVYDVKTKQEIASAITDIDGRFGFLLKAGRYFIKAAKTHYLFPSKLLAGQTKDELYDNLYFGAEFTVKDGEVLHLDIPMDPLNFDWNEFVKTKTSYFQIYSRRDLIRRHIVRTIYWAGFIAALAMAIIFPSWFNFAAVGLYIVIYLVEKWWKIKYKASQLAKNGEPLPFAIVRLYFAEINQEVKHLVTDPLGRFYLLVRPGRYYFTVEEKQPDGSYLKTYQSQPLLLDKGILPEKIDLA